MERVISDEERIKRAIEISQRRTANYYANESARVNVNNKKSYKLFKKMILQIIICLLIYSIFYLISSTNYIFSEQVIKSTVSILDYDINFENWYNSCRDFLNSKINVNKEINEHEEIVENVNQENAITNNITENKISSTQIQKITTQESVMRDDSETVKKVCTFKKPLSGTITSEFGERETTSKIVSSDHKGIDIAAKSGTNIKSAIEGIVSQASENTEYGKFIKIINGDVMTVYAHCKKLKVKEGDKVKLGDKIATVGSTGNSTGPHLHFEIRLSNRYINPRYVIEF